MSDFSALRQAILKDPDLVLDDPEVMQALISAHGLSDQGKIVDLRSVLQRRLEERLDLITETHKSVLSAAYENTASTQQIQRAVLELLEACSYRDFIETLTIKLRDKLKLDTVLLAIETPSGKGKRIGPEDLLDQVCALGAGEIENYMSNGAEDHPILLRPVPQGRAEAFQDKEVMSEAILRLDLGRARMPAMLIFGSSDPLKFAPGQATDLLEFLRRVVEISLIKWLEA